MTFRQFGIEPPALPFHQMALLNWRILCCLGGNNTTLRDLHPHTIRVTAEYTDGRVEVVSSIEIALLGIRYYCV